MNKNSIYSDTISTSESSSDFGSNSDLCRRGAECPFLLQGKCHYLHLLADINWARSERNRKRESIPCKKLSECVHEVLGTCQYLHTKSDSIAAIKAAVKAAKISAKPLKLSKEKSRKITPCENGENCTYLLSGKCEFEHDDEDVAWAEEQRKSKGTTAPCQDGRNCRHLERGNCKFLHTKEETEAAERIKKEMMKQNQKNKCPKGEDCIYLLLGTCQYEHEEDDVKWAEEQRNKKQMKAVCNKKADCKHLKSGKCNYLHTREETEAAKNLVSEEEAKEKEGKCQNGKDCTYLLTRTCKYRHEREEIEWTENQREKKQTKALCKYKADCKNLAREKECPHLHTMAEVNEVKKRRMNNRAFSKRISETFGIHSIDDE